MSRNGCIAFIPERYGTSRELTELFRKETAFFGSFADSAVHVFGVSHHDMFSTLLFCEGSGFFYTFIEILFGDNADRRGDKLAFAADGNACSCVPEVN